MQSELNSVSTVVSIQIGGINRSNQSRGTAAEGFCAGTTLPYLQEGATDNVYSSWNAAKDDLYIVDKDGNFAGYYDLAQYDLDTPANRTLIKDALIELANAQ